ncbi:hypothetical protein TREMEDRAFT_60702 [Tremella mesenterica DSM 1558]|uniref:uncharacterized protein n=1 Tax=Tremella mesenterica (strain ATCC 24925 / CBS 8224 / DSM 1558 / NBRC 9311 / NRRL Y-6157 / RJB 2259-6 / UBC 559-6) TaxID=578456 RepID=UPI0003F4A51D|nr:uncharacterized protein TREMEDRAFT_60702 [Tremella mesenterica DSM 1558]EIW71787.1 hypothetical protein TREMEDRAFT_60702 [Tremella mesenterica DSM 1558]
MPTTKRCGESRPTRIRLKTKLGASIDTTQSVWTAYHRRLVAYVEGHGVNGQQSKTNGVASTTRTGLTILRCMLRPVDNWHIMQLESSNDHKLVSTTCNTIRTVITYLKKTYLEKAPEDKMDFKRRRLLANALTDPKLTQHGPIYLSMKAWQAWPQLYRSSFRSYELALGSGKAPH